MCSGKTEHSVVSFILTFAYLDLEFGLYWSSMRKDISAESTACCIENNRLVRSYRYSAKPIRPVTEQE